MRALDVERTPVGHSTIDLCERCHALWFDAFESVRLTPSATIALFREVHGAAAPAPRALPEHLPCPRCRATLVATQDLQRSTRFTYWRCPNRHGRFTPFVQFLREKNFVRTLSPAELATLKLHVRTVRCSGCGAPVDLARDMVCRYCRAPVEALDPDAVAETLGRLEEAERGRTTIDVARLADALLAQAPRPAWRTAIDVAPDSGLDLIGTGIALVVSALSGR